MDLKQEIAKREEARMERLVNEMNSPKNDTPSGTVEQKPTEKKKQTPEEKLQKRAEYQRNYQREYARKKRREAIGMKDEPVQAGDQAMKADGGKPRLSLVPMLILTAIARIREYGCRKYKDPDNWKNVAPERYRDALLRHVTAYIDDPFGRDAESGLPHLWHVACNVAFLIHLEWERMKDE